MDSTPRLDLSTMLVYLTAIVSVGLRFARKQTSTGLTLGRAPRVHRRPSAAAAELAVDPLRLAGSKFRARVFELGEALFQCIHIH